MNTEQDDDEIEPVGNRQVYPFTMDDDKCEHLTVEWGIQLREEFAKSMLQGILASGKCSLCMDHDSSAAQAVKFADALLNALHPPRTR